MWAGQLLNKPGKGNNLNLHSLQVKYLSGNYENVYQINCVLKLNLGYFLHYQQHAASPLLCLKYVGQRTYWRATSERTWHPSPKHIKIVVANSSASQSHLCSVCASASVSCQQWLSTIHVILFSSAVIHVPSKSWSTSFHLAMTSCSAVLRFDPSSDHRMWNNSQRTSAVSRRFFIPNASCICPDVLKRSSRLLAFRPVMNL